MGDIVTYDFDDNTNTFEVVFEQNAFRKKYKGWNSLNPRPLLEYGRDAQTMRLKVLKPAIEKA